MRQMARPVERAKAREMWLQSDGKRSVQSIADELGMRSATVRTWKSHDCWDDLLAEKLEAEGKPPKRPAPEKGNKRAKGHGAPVGNRNGVGGGAPVGNMNGFKHGAFERFVYKYMDDEEQQVADDTAINGIEQELLSQLAFLKARELRLMRRIDAIQRLGESAKRSALSSITQLKSEKRMGLWETGEGGELVKQEGTGMYDGEWLDEQTVSTMSIEDGLNRLEAELSRVQAQKIKILTQLDTMRTERERLEIERIRAQGENEQSKLANDWVEALLQLYIDGADGGGSDG